MKFEDAMLTIEKIIEKLEKGSDDLDEMVRMFEEGSQLIQQCYSRLETIETKIQTITTQTQKEKRGEDV